MIVYPVVPKDVIMLRIIPTAVHTISDVNETFVAFEAIKHKLDDGVYAREGEKAAISALNQGF
jgi:glycine C-acetyltransferase